MRSVDVVALDGPCLTRLANARNEAGTTYPARRRARRTGYPRHRVAACISRSSEQLRREEW